MPCVAKTKGAGPGVQPGTRRAATGRAPVRPTMPGTAPRATSVRTARPAAQQPPSKTTATLSRAAASAPRPKPAATSRTTAARTARKPAAARAPAQTAARPSRTVGAPAAGRTPATDRTPVPTAARATARAGRANGAPAAARSTEDARASARRAARSAPADREPTDAPDHPPPPASARSAPADREPTDGPDDPNPPASARGAVGAIPGDDPGDDAGPPIQPVPGGSAHADPRSAPTRPGVLRGGPDDDPEHATGRLRVPAIAISGGVDDRDDDDRDDDGDRDDSAAPAEPLATRDIARLLRYGERFGNDKIDVRMLPLQFHARSGAIAVCDPGRPETWRVLERSIGSGAFRVMLSVARPADDAGAGERLAAVVIHVGRPPIARWTVAQVREPEPAAPDAVPRTPITTGWLALLDAGDGSPGVIALPPPAGVMPVEVPLTDGRRALAVPCGNGAFAAYWALDADDRPICAVIDFHAFTRKAWYRSPRSG